MNAWVLVLMLGVIAVLGIAALLYGDQSSGPEPPASLQACNDQARAEALERIRARHADVDIARRDQPRRPVTQRDVEARREGQRLSKGW